MMATTRDHIWLVCCIGVSRKEHFCRPFLRHFVHHYLGLGVPPANFLITLHAPGPGEEIDWAEHALARHGIAVSGYLLKEYDCYDFYECNVQLISARPPDDWIVVVDFDELIEFPSALPEYVETVETAGFNTVSGYLIDRFAPGYHLAEIKEGPPIWDQFPIQTEFTKDVVQGYSGKICLFRNRLRINLGHHAVLAPPAEPARFSHNRLRVHHFKWDATLEPKLRMRRAQFKADPERYRWHGEPDRILELINCGRIEFHR